MVIEDLGESFVQKPLSKKIKKSSLALALPFDRLAALIADLVLFLPISSLVMAFFKKEMILIQLTGTEVQLHAYLLFYVFVFFILAFLYQSFFLILIGRSPGKYFFGLKILDIWSEEKPKWSQVLLRNFYWWIDLLTVFPMAAVFFDSHRRPLHDRIADTVVVNLKEKKACAPSFLESLMARIFLASFFVLFLGVVSWSTWKNYGDSFDPKQSLQRWAGGISECQRVSKLWPEWKKQKRGDRRLELAMSLFAIEEISEECLGKEAEFVLWFEKSDEELRSLAYLAKAFAKMEEGTISDEYLDQVCRFEKETRACALSSFFRNTQDEKKALTFLGKLNDIRTPEYAKLWITRYFYKKGYLEEAKRQVDDLSLGSHVSHFLSEMKLKIFWRLGEKKQAREIFKVFWENKNPEVEDFVTSWLCYKENQFSCSPSSASCRVLSQQNEKKSEEFMSSLQGLALYRDAECQQKKLNGRIQKKISPELLSYFGELTKESSLKEIYSSEQYSEKIRQDALYRIISLGASNEIQSELFREWLQTPVDSWEKYDLGESFYQKFNKVEDYKNALKTAQHIFSWRRGKKEVYMQALSLYELGEIKSASDLILKHEESTKPISHRSPASSKEKIDTYEKLKAKVFLLQGRSQ